MYGLGYHWFWDNFNLRLGLAAGTMNFDYIDLKNNSGTVAESTRPFNVDINGPNGWIDLAIGWAFFLIIKESSKVMIGHNRA